MWFNEPEQWKRARQTRKFLCWFPAFMLLAVVGVYSTDLNMLFYTSIRLMPQRRVIDIKIKSLWRHFTRKPTERFFDACFPNKSHRARTESRSLSTRLDLTPTEKVSHVGKIIFLGTESNKTSPNSHKFTFRIILKAVEEKVLFSGKFELFLDIELLSELLVNWGAAEENQNCSHGVSCFDFQRKTLRS